MNRAGYLLADAGIEKQYWPECVKTTEYQGNQLLANLFIYLLLAYTVLI